MGDGRGGEQWRAQLDGYLAPAGAIPADAVPAGDVHRVADARGTASLGLQFQLRELLPRTVHRWNGPTSQAAPAPAADADAPDGRRLGVRPVTRTERGWARGSLTWQALPHLRNRLDLDAAQHRWGCEFAALHRAAVPPAAGQDADWIFLDDFANPVLWSLFEQAAALSIAFVPVGGGGAVRGGAVRVGALATVTLDAVRDGTGLRVGPRLVVDGRAVAAGRARPIGAHGLYLADRGDLLLAPFAGPLDPEGLALLRAGSVEVPNAAVADFAAEYLPRLQDRLPVTSSDASVTLPPPAPPTLVLTLRAEPAGAIALEWHWSGGRRAAPPPDFADVLPDVLPDRFLEPAGRVPAPVLLPEEAAADFVLDVLPRLRAAPGVRVDTVGTLPDYRALHGAPLLTITALESERTDWFDLGVTVRIAGRTVPFLPLFKAIAAGRTRLVLVDKSVLLLDRPELARLRDLVQAAADLPEWESGFAVGRQQAALWAELVDLADAAEPPAAWRALLAEVREPPLPIDVPTGLNATMRPYQQEGLNWLAFLHRHALGGVLADDMGLGKTLQCLALVQHLAERTPRERRRPFLIVVPTSVVSNWAAEAARFAPGLVVRTIGGTQAASGMRIAELALGADIVVTTYALLRLDVDALQAVARAEGWAGLILDEAQFVKSAAAQVHASARDLDIRWKLAVTGTPLENSLTELHALFAIVAPGLLPAVRRFREEYVRPIEGVRPGITGGAGAGEAATAAGLLRAERLDRLRGRIRPFLLRRTKAEVAPELPAKEEQLLKVDLAPDHRALYDVFLQRERRKLFGLLPDLDRNRFIVFRSLTLLRLLALDAGLIGQEHAGIRSAKLDLLVHELHELLMEGRRALVFSQFPSYLRIVAARLAAEGIAATRLDGATGDRDAVIAEFRSGAAPVFLISLKAGGFGLNLTEADMVFLLDPWWNPASEAQAIDRTHRIGQRRPVTVRRLVAAGTIEEKVLALQRRKSALFDAVIDDAAFSAAITADDVRELFG